MSQIRLPAQMKSLEAFLQFVSTYARRYGFSPKRINQIELSVEEALVNIFHYAYRQMPGDVEVSCRIDDPRGFVTEISDQGIPFDLLSVQVPDLDEDVLDRPAGGLGVHIIRKIVDETRYRRQGKNNIVTFIFYGKDEK